MIPSRGEAGAVLFRDGSCRLWSLLNLMRFYATAFAIVVGRLERAWHAIAVAASIETATED